MALATSKGLFKVDSAGAFRPLSTVTRGEMAVLLDRLDRLQEDKLDQAGTVSQVVLGTAPRVNRRLSNGTTSTLYLSQDVWLERSGAGAAISSLSVGDRGGRESAPDDHRHPGRHVPIANGTILLTVDGATTAFPSRRPR